jgi:hypothetical protein
VLQVASKAEEMEVEEGAVLDDVVAADLHLLLEAAELMEVSAVAQQQAGPLKVR